MTSTLFFLSRPGNFFASIMAQESKPSSSRIVFPMKAPVRILSTWFSQSTSQKETQRSMNSCILEAYFPRVPPWPSRKEVMRSITPSSP